MTDSTNSVTDALPERDTTKTAEQQGLFRKFDVRRVDGSDQLGGKHHGCRYYVLDVDHDPYAAAALGAYADACKESHPELARDLREKWGAANTIGTLRAPPAAVAEPVAWMTVNDDGDPLMLFFDHIEAMSYCNEGEVPIELFTADQLAAAVAAERERCAQLCERMKRECYTGWEESMLQDCADAIRSGK